MKSTPINDIKKYDNLSPLDAVIRSWNKPGIYPQHHNAMKDVVRDSMPLLARALDRLSRIERTNTRL